MKKIIILFLGIALVDSTFGQINLDLAKIKPGEKFSQTVEPQTINSIVLENALVNIKEKYSINIEEKKMPAVPFSIDDKDLKGMALCKDLEQLPELEKQINDAKNETEISVYREKLEGLIKKADKKTCINEITRAQNLINKTKRICPLTQPINLEKGEQVIITITRDTLKWTFTYSTSTENPWSILYGFTYVLNWPNRYDTYFSKAAAGDTFLITKQNNQINSNKVLKNITPTLMFTWKPVNKFKMCEKPIRGFLSNDLWQFGLTGGISLDLSNPSAMISPSIIFADNLSVSFGVVFTQNDILNGKYKEGEKITENLSFDQLHEKRYGPKAFISLAFRFDKNIFQKTKETETKK